MKPNGLAQSIKKEMNDRRRKGGAAKVEEVEWEAPGVATAFQAAVKCAEEEGFEGDWDCATAPLEEALDIIASALFRLSRIGPSRRWRGEAYYPLTQHQPPLTELIQRPGRLSRPPSPMIRKDAGGRALASFLSRQLKQDGLANYIRRHVCKDDYLTREEAWEFLTSPLPKLFSFEEYEQFGLTPAKAKCEVQWEYKRVDGLFFETNSFKIDKVTGETTLSRYQDMDTQSYSLKIFTDHSAETGRVFEEKILRTAKGNYAYISHSKSTPQSWQIIVKDAEAYPDPAPAPFFSDEIRYIEGYSDSAMRLIISIANTLCCSGYIGYGASIWDMLEALLTGQFPDFSSVELLDAARECKLTKNPDEPSSSIGAKFISQGPATLTVQPWVTPEALADFWRDCRKKNPCYSPTEKQAETMRFVLENTPPGDEFQWERLAKQWRESRGEPMTRSQLYKQFLRARDSILPGYEEKKGDE